MARAQGVIHSMFLRKLTATLAIVVCIGLFGAALGVLTNDRVEARPAAAPDGEVDVALQEVAAQENDKTDEIQEALRKAVAFLKGAQANGNWETPQSQAHLGGFTSLAVWALLEAGVKTDDPAVTRGLAYLRTIEPRGTYVVSLQTVALCRTGLKQDQELIKRNVKWLLDAMVKDERGKCRGWTYTKSPARGDNSNTQYAVMALDAAARAGVAIDGAVWRQIKDHYLRSQLADGGWGYFWSPDTASHSTANMTSAGIAGLAICQHHLKEKPGEPMQLGLGRLAVLYGKANTGAELYYRNSLNRAAALSGQNKFENNFTGQTFDWRTESRRLLLKTQTADGSWQSTHSWERPPALGTSFAILALAATNAKK
jgi:hypothetical protein